MAIIAILIAVLLPAVQRVRANARSSQSKNNLSQMGKALKHYEGLGRGNLRHTNWRNSIAPFVEEQHEVFVDPADANGGPSYAATDKIGSMGANDYKKIVIVESDDDMITIDNENCTGGTSTITGGPAARHLGMTNALLYGGSVQSFDPAKIDLADPSHEPLVIWWLPDREHGSVCGSVVTVDNPNPLPSPTGTQPDTALEPSASEPAPPAFPECETCDVNANLVAHYPMDNFDPSEDISGNGNHGQMYGNPAYSAERGGCLLFDGTNDYVDVPDDILKNDAGTVSVWMRTTTFSVPWNTRKAFSNENSVINGQVTNRLYIGMDAPQYAPSGNSGNVHISFDTDKHKSEYQLGLDQWHHVVVVWCNAAGTAQAYIDGQQVFEDEVAYTEIGRWFVNIGSYREGLRSYWQGYVDDVRVYDCALSPSQFPQ